MSQEIGFVSKDRGGNGHRKRTGEVLFIDARRMGKAVTRKWRTLADSDIARIAGTYHSWRNHDGNYEDVPGFSTVATLDQIAAHDFILTPGRYVGTEEIDADTEPTQEKLARLTEELLAELAHSRKLDDKLDEALRRVSHG